MNISPITNFRNQVLEHKGPNQERGWDYNTTDTNTGVGGKYIYIGYQRNNFTEYVTSLRFEAFDKEQKEAPAGWQWTGQDLNQGAGGKYIYQLWKTGEQNVNPILGIILVVTDAYIPPKIDGWQSIPQDLNQGARGPYIWPYYTTVGYSAYEKLGIVEAQ